MTDEEPKETSSLLKVLALGYIIGAALTYPKVMPAPVDDPMTQTLNLAKATATSLIWPIHWAMQFV